MILRSIRFYQEKIKEDSIWLTIYSDMMTNLMLFFLLMFGLSRMPEEMRAKIAEGVENNFRSQKTEKRLKQVIKRFREEESVFQMNKVVEEKEMKTFTRIEVEEDKIKLTMQNQNKNQSPVLFLPGQSEITNQDTKDFLRELAVILDGLPNEIVIGGHTDNVPVSSSRYKNNWELSVARALNVERILEGCGVDPKRLIVAGYGEFTPLYPNDTKKSMALNRRIEIDIIR